MPQTITEAPFEALDRIERQNKPEPIRAWGLRMAQFCAARRLQEELWERVRGHPKPPAANLLCLCQKDHYFVFKIKAPFPGSGTICRNGLCISCEEDSLIR